MRRRIRHTARRSRWVQVNCALFHQTAGGQPYVPWQALSTTLERWRCEGRFRLCFFTRKPPGLRLRFYGDGLAHSLDAELITWLEEAERQNAIRGFRFALYEPETFRFGGPAGMEIA